MFSRKVKGQGLVSSLIGILIFIVISVAVVLPTVNDAVQSVNMTSESSEAISSVFSMFPLIIGILVLIVPIVMFYRVFDDGVYSPEPINYKQKAKNTKDSLKEIIKQLILSLKKFKNEGIQIGNKRIKW